MAKSMMKSDKMCMCGGMCSRCKGWKAFIVGLIFLINYFWPFADWWMLVGLLLTLAGLVRIIKPSCGHCC